MRKRKDGGLPCGSTTFVLVRTLHADRLFRWQAQTSCLDCGRPFTLRRGEASAVLRAGNEVVGAVCADCLPEKSRQQLQSMRGEATS